MIKQKYARITATASYLPKRVLSNTELEAMVNTSDSWIRERTGIKERRIAASDEFTSTLGLKAAEKTLHIASFDPKNLDAIIVSTMTPDFISPNTATIIQHQLGAVNSCAISVEAACTGFLYALSIAKAWVEAGMYKNVLVIASEKILRLLTILIEIAVFFGDGAGACLVQDSGNGYAIKHVTLGADGSLSNLIEIPGGGSRSPATAESVEQRQHFLKIQGREVFKHAVRRMEESIITCLKEAHITEQDIDYLIPHQANMRIIEAIAKRFSIPWDRVYKTIERYGNTSSSTIPIALCELTQEVEIKDKENIVLTSFGGGLTWAAALLTSMRDE